MQRIVILIGMLAIACMASAQASMNNDPSIPPRGQEPPAWLKNKVTQAQYDTLAQLAKHFEVDYSYFKLRNLTPQRISDFMKGAGRMLSTPEYVQMADSNGHVRYSKEFPLSIVSPLPCCGISADKIKKGKPVEVRFLVYSDRDGYDGHVILTARLTRLAGTQKVAATDMQLVAYSVSGLKVMLKMAQVNSAKNFSEEISQLDFDADGRTDRFYVNGLLCVEDAMGNWHETPFNQKTVLAIP